MSKSIRHGFILAAALLSLFSCPLAENVEVPNTQEGISLLRLPDSVHKVEFGENGEYSLPLNGVQGDNVYIVKVNATDTIKSAASPMPLQSIAGETLASVAGAEGGRPAGTVTLDGKTLIRYERRWDIMPPLGHNTLRTNRSGLRSFAEPAEGDTKSFYIDATSVTACATLKKNGRYCRIWVADENFTEDASTNNDNLITGEQINALAAKFDRIYPLETNLLGYEYGGGPGGDGGMDGDRKIQILLYDIYDDFSATHDHPSGITLGYFYPGDAVPDETPVEGGGVYSNQAEIFYLDVEMLDADPASIYTTLIHEFNHMINFNVKVIQTEDYTNYETWYTEMLSMLAEDVIGPLADIPYIPRTKNGNVIIERIHLYWLAYYIAGVMQWDNSNPLPYYASNYAFGAYLARNFGGPELLSRIAKSNNGGKASLDEALKALNKTVDGTPVDHSYALSRFGEALVYSGAFMPQYAFSFDKTATGTVGGLTYTFPRFNIWQMGYSVGDSKPRAGPTIYSYSDNNSAMNAYSVQLYSKDEWLGIKDGSLTVDLSGGDPDILCYVMVKPFH